MIKIYDYISSNIAGIAIIISSLTLIGVLISALKKCWNADTYDMTGL